MNYELFDHGHKQIFLVNMSKELTHDFSLLAQKGIEKYLGLGKKI